MDSFPSTAESEMTLSDTLTVDDWREEKCRDKTISRVSSIIRLGEERIRREPLRVQKFLYKSVQEVDTCGCSLVQNLIYDGQKVRLLVLPMRDVALQGIHDNVGRPGKDKTLWLAKQWYYWPGIEQDIIKKVETFSRCICSKTPVRSAAVCSNCYNKTFRISLYRLS